MASGPEAESSSHDEGLTDLVRRIQAGDQAAIQSFRSMFSPGVEFLLRRKLEKSAVAAETARVLQAAVQDIAAAPPAQAINLPHLITRTMQRLCPPARRGVESGTADETTDSLADSILAERTPLEQDILRRYYVLRESPEEIKTNLRVSSRTIQQTIARARAAFRQKLQRSESA